MERLEGIEEIANRILQENPDPVVRFRILRDVLRVAPDADVVTEARRQMLTSRWVRELRNDQCEDGSWGRFHSRDSKIKKKIMTTEMGVDRGLALGLDATDQVFKPTINYLLKLLDRLDDFPDPPEHNNRWHTGKQLFVAATLAKLQPTSSALDETLRLWTTIVTRTFASGQYDPQAEILAHRELTGSSVQNSYLVLNNRYTVALLSSKPTLLPESVEKSFADWIWHGKKGIGYLEASLSHLPESLLSRRFDLWFTSLELISDFPGWQNSAEDVVDWLWAQRDERGLWNCGRETNASHYFPLSESWRKKQNRKHDCSTRVLSLLRKYYS